MTSSKKQTVCTVIMSFYLRGFQDRRLALLDVGSCYNPFEEFSQEVNALAIDLCPANKVCFYI